MYHNISCSNRFIKQIKLPSTGLRKNPRMQEIYIQATIKNQPSLAEMNDHVFEVTERYVTANATKKIVRIDVKGISNN